MRRTTVSRYIILAAVLATTLLIGVKSSTAQVELRLAEACVAGYPAACTRLRTIARRACLNGDSDWCSIAAQLAAIQEPATPSYPHYDPSPLAPYRDIIQDTNKYINSYCSDPKIAAQLRAFNYCR